MSKFQKRHYEDLAKSFVKELVDYHQYDKFSEKLQEYIRIAERLDGNFNGDEFRSYILKHYCK